MSNRRIFIRKMLAGAAALHYTPGLLQASTIQAPAVSHSKNLQPVRIALIGKGGMGTSDTRTALQVEGVQLTGVCDLYDARLEDARKLWGDDLLITKNYQDLLSRKEVDAVIIATPDHWHQQIAIDSLKAGKHVYCEKPVIHHLKEADALIKAQQQSNCLFQVGSQGMASLGNRVARQLVQAGAIGQVNLIEAQFTAVPGSLEKFIPPQGASEKTIWWEQFLGKAPKRPFDPQRFFQWRNWNDYGTGLAGDLFVHVLSSLHFIMDAIGPEKVYASGGLNYYTNGTRDTPDILLGCFDYPAQNGQGAFKVSLGANYADGISKKWGSMNFTIVGEKGTLQVEWGKVLLKTLHDADPKTFDSVKQIGQGMDNPQKVSSKEYLFTAENGYKGGHYDHFSNFFEGIRNQTPLTADVLFAVRSAAPALLCNLSYSTGNAVYWNAEELKTGGKT
ncbi:MAG: Gfo/Idh/MocA family protein [Mangrovibacterium sp.]